MEASDLDGARVRFPPPLIYLAALIAAVLFHAFVLPVPMRFPLGVRVLLGLAAAGLGLALMFSAMRLFRRTGQDPKPWKATPNVISTGVYRFSRNPMYVGMALLQAAIGIGLANAWMIALVPVVLVLVYFIAVRHEEAYLERKFGNAYSEYKETVRRWL